MSNTPPSGPLPPPRASGDHDPILLSPLMTLIPTGYRNIQPFQKGKGWHTNGQTPRRRVASPRSSDGVKDDQHLFPKKHRGVVFPPLPGQESERGAQGPDASVVKGAAILNSGDQRDNRQERDEAASGSLLTSPRAPSTPPKSVAPRRPSRTDIRSNPSSGGSFRSRALSGSPSNGNSSRPTSPATMTNSEEKLKNHDDDKSKAVPGPDPVIMQQLWQEYAARSHAANRVVDAATYHEKMHRRYGEQRALKERITQLEQALEQMENERNQAQARADGAAKQLELLASDRSTSELSGTSTASDSMPTTRSSFIRPTPIPEPANAEEKSYRERSFVLERALAQAKTSLLALREQLLQQTTQAAERIQALEAQLVLERKSSLELARQLREASAGFSRASAELVETRVVLEREQQRAQEMADQARVQNAQLLSDTRRAQLETRMKLAVRSLGREAMRHKLEALMGRALRAEQNMRVAQIETERIRRERDATREQLEQVLSSHAIKYHALGAAGGVPGILKRSTTLSNRSRMVSGQLLLLQVLYEETEEPEDPDDGFSVHFVAYEPRSAQDDFLSFHLRDVQRLVPNHGSYLAPHSVRRRERLEEVAELLLGHVHAGYKNGHLVLAETSGPEAATRLPLEQLAAQQEQQHARQITVYRGTRYIQFVGMDDEVDAVLAELNVTEAFAAATSQVWWLEIRAVMLGYEGNCDIESLTTKVDLRQLLTFCATFASYRPSESLEGSNNDDAELFAVHEELLEPLLTNLRVVYSEPGGILLEVVGFEHESRPSSSATEPQKRLPRLSVEICDGILGLDGKIMEVSQHTKTTTVVPSTLTYQFVVNVGDVFYCVRLQELWDGELLLDITMDDPDTQHHFHRVLHEPQLAKLAARLVRDGALEGNQFEENSTREEQEAAALQVKYGLSRVLHRPLCKLVKNHIQPVLPHSSQGRSNVTSTGDISLGTLFEDEEKDKSSKMGVETDEVETQTVVLDSSLCASFGSNYHLRELDVIGASREFLTDEHAVYQLFQQVFTMVESNAGDVRRQRTASRFQGSANYSLIKATSVTLPSCGNVTLVDVLSLTPESLVQNRLPLVLVVNGPKDEQVLLQQAFKAIGLITEDASPILVGSPQDHDDG